MKKAIKEFIIEEHTNACSEWKQKIESRWPELFESQFKNGDWIKLKDCDKTMVCISNLEQSKAYGFDYEGDWISDEKHSNWTFRSKPSGWQPATESEISTALIAEAKRQGYKNGNYKCLYMPNNTEAVNDNVIEFEPETNSLWLGEGGHCNKVFDNGRWAKIIEEEKPDFKEGDVVVVVKSWGGIKKGELHKVTDITEFMDRKYIYIGKTANNLTEAFRHATEKEKALYRLQELESEIKEIKSKL